MTCTTDTSVGSADRPALSSDLVIDALVVELIANADLRTGLGRSLRAAAKTASDQLDDALFFALQWPTNTDDYIEYLRTFARWSPQQSPHGAWHDSANASQEVYDRLCHFYFLLDQPDEAGIRLQDDPFVEKWLDRYTRAWGTFLSMPDSWNEEMLHSFLDDSAQFRAQDSMVEGQPNSPWNSFNDFFSRSLNPGLRPIAHNNDNTRPTCPADCSYMQQLPIEADSSIKEITLKGTHRVSSIRDLLPGSPYEFAFAGGTFVHYYLGANSYHRLHTPVAGMIEECRTLHRQTYLDVTVVRGQFDAPDTTRGGYEFSQARGILVIDTARSDQGDIGLVAVIPVGLAHVSSVQSTAAVGPCDKGDEFGHFLFGGSEVIVLFQAGVQPDIDPSLTYRHVGTPMATCTELH